ncbi:MAG: 2-amino-4-hydroxy-6-hydroxymethyldihydropteridine diphosphokinase [Gammaproteobacteria bacterium]|nr:2-amino-4-hydroxy-6-hydroxymethyldihydropteridine diphosphokinase [Gammaproteobacteria bacterium]
MNNVFIGLGSNLDEPLSQLNKAIERLKQLKTLTFIKASNFYSSPPMGPQDQPDYINAVVEVKTNLMAEQLLDELQKIENDQGRIRTQHWGARTLDLDILLFGKDVINSERLIVPHCGISERNFVLYPLSDLLDSNFKIPGLGGINDLLADCPMTGLIRLTEA